MGEIWEGGDLLRAACGNLYGEKEKGCVRARTVWVRENSGSGRPYAVGGWLSPTSPLGLPHQNC